MATITDTTTDANGNVIVDVSSSADDSITLATAGTYSDKNIIFNLAIETGAAQTALQAAENASKSADAAKASEIATADSASAAQQSATSAAESAAVYDDIVADVNQIKDDLSAYRTSIEQDRIDSGLDNKIETAKQLFKDTINITTTGISPVVKRAILNCFANVAWLSPDGAELYKGLYNALNAEPDLTPVPEPPSICVVSTLLSNCSIDSDGITDVIYGSEYRAVISALDGYRIHEVTVGMGGLVIDAYNAETGEIIIQEVTGNITIIASAKPYLNVNIPISNFKKASTIITNPPYFTSSNAGRQCYIGKLGIGVANCTYRITPVFVSGVENTSLSFASQRASRENVDKNIKITKEDTGWINGFGTDKTYFDITDSFDSYIWLVINSSNDVSNIISHFNIKIIEEA